MRLSRRQFSTQAAIFAAVAATPFKSWAMANSSVNLGLNAWSLRSLSQTEAIPVIIQCMKQAALQDCQLLFSHVEPAKLSPVFPVGVMSAPKQPPTSQQIEEQKATATALTEWRMSVPMSYFENIRSQFQAQNLHIKSYAARLGSTRAEVDRLFLMAHALGVDSLNARVPEAMTGMVADAAAKHKMIVGLQVSDIHLLQKQLATSKFFRIDADIGDLTKAQIDPVSFVQAHYLSMSSMDLKDARKGGISVPFGEGDAHMKDILLFLKEKQVAFTSYVDCDYAGTGRSVEEVMKCTAYVRGSLS